MDPIIQTYSIHRTKGPTEWYAKCTERLFCLFKCAYCGKINVLRLPVSYTVEIRREKDALAEVDRKRPMIMKELKVPGPNQGHMLRATRCKCLCTSCYNWPAWTTEIQDWEKKAVKSSAVRGEALCVGLLIMILFAIIHDIFPEIPWIQQIFPFFLVPSGVLLLWGSPGIRDLFLIRKGKQVDRGIQDAIQDFPPLLGDSLDEIVSKAKDCELYADADVRADMEYLDLTDGNKWYDKAMGREREPSD